MLPISHRLSGMFVLSLIAVMLFSACSAINVSAPTKDASAKALMPNVAGYNATASMDIASTLGNLGSAGAALSGQLEVVAAIAVAQRVAGCYTNAGAFESNVYVNQTDPSKLGIVMIINNSVITNPQIFLSCLNPGGKSAQSAGNICSKNYTLNDGGKSYQIMYAATDFAVCNDFCNNLKECTIH